jgi:hypothetical protein
MKFMSKFKLKSLYHGKHIVSPIQDIFLDYWPPFFLDQVEALII